MSIYTDGNPCINLIKPSAYNGRNGLKQNGIGMHKVETNKNTQSLTQILASVCSTIMLATSN